MFNKCNYILRVFIVKDVLFLFIVFCMLLVYYCVNYKDGFVEVCVFRD